MVVKVEDVQKYVVLTKDIVQVGLNLTAENTVANKVLRVIEGLLNKGCLVDTAVYVVNAVGNFNSNEFNNVVGTKVLEDVKPSPTV